METEDGYRKKGETGMGIFIIGAVLLLGFCLLAANSLKNKKMGDVLLFSILLVLSGLSFMVFANEGAMSVFGLILSAVGLLVGMIRFFIRESDEIETEK